MDIQEQFDWAVRKGTIYEEIQKDLDTACDKTVDQITNNLEKTIAIKENYQKEVVEEVN